MKYLEMIFAFLIAVLAVTMWILMIEYKPSFGEIIEGCFVPYVPKGSLIALVGLMGCVIMPHNLYLHSSLVLDDPERKVDKRDDYELRKAMTYYWIETGLALLLSIFISLAIIVVFAEFYGTG